jgi:hypothetical protein
MDVPSLTNVGLFIQVICPWFPSRNNLVQGKRREDDENVLPLQHISRRY